MIYVVAFDPIKILTCWALQNDGQNLSFVKTINSVVKKWLEVFVKWPTPNFVIFISKQSLQQLSLYIHINWRLGFQFGPQRIRDLAFICP